MAGRRRALGPAVVLLAALSACSSSGSPAPATSSLYTPAFPATGVVCGFVPAGVVRQIVGSQKYDATGSTGHAYGSVIGSCSVRSRDGQQPLLGVSLTAPAASSPATDPAGLRTQVASAPNGWYLYPRSTGVGFARAEFAVPGTDRAGAITAVSRGDYGLLAQVYVPSPGRRAITQAVRLADAIFDSLHIPSQVTSPAPSH